MASTPGKQNVRLLSEEEKKRLIATLERDPEFRYSLMGLLGFKEILDRITRLEERFAKLEEKFLELEKRFAKLEERQLRLEERQQRLEERQQRLEERQQRLEERQQRLEERQQRLEERMTRLEERVTRVEERLEQLERAVITIGNRFGALSENVFRDAMKGIVEEYLGGKVEHWTHYDEKGLVYGHPSVVEADLVIKDGVHILVELKSRANKSDVAELVRLARVYEEKEKTQPQMVLVAGSVAKGVRELALSLGVKVYTYLEDRGSE